MKSLKSYAWLLVLAVIILSGCFPSAPSSSAPTQDIQKEVVKQLTVIAQQNPTSVPTKEKPVVPTLAPKPKDAVDKLAYFDKIYGWCSDLADEMDTFSVIISAASTEDIMDASWKRLVYGNFATIVEISRKLAQEPAPAGYQDLQGYFQEIHRELALAEDDFHIGIDGFDMEYINRSTEHILNASAFIDKATLLIQ